MSEFDHMQAAIMEFLQEHPDVANPALILHGILQKHPEFRGGEEFDLDAIGRMVQWCEEPPR